MKPLLIKFPEGDNAGKAVNIPNPNEWNDISPNVESLTNIELLGDSKTEIKINVKSIPSPYARMILFKNAFDGKYKFPNDMRNDIFEDIINVMEFLFLIKSTPYFDKLVVEEVDFTRISDDLDGSSLPVHQNYVNILKDFSESYTKGNETKSYEKIKILHFPQNSQDFDNILCGTSPFTGFFTPESTNLLIPGFFDKKYDNQGSRVFKTMQDRNIEFVKFLLVFIDRLPTSASDFKNFLSEKLREHSDPAVNDNPIIESDLREDKNIEIIPGVKFPYYDKTPDVKSYFKIRPTIRPIDEKTGEYEQLPLILTKRCVNDCEFYFDSYKFGDKWEEKLNQALKDPENGRSILPGSTTRYPWLYPEIDFLEDKLIKLPHKLDSGKMFDGEQNKSLFQFLIPLKEKYFEYFKPKDIEKYLRYDIEVAKDDNNDKVTIILRIPVVGMNGKLENVDIKKIYSSADNTIDYVCFPTDQKTGKINPYGIYLALWPAILNPRKITHLNKYYVLEYQQGPALEENWSGTEFYCYDYSKEFDQLKHIKNNPVNEPDRECYSEVKRNIQTKIFSLKYAPEIIQLKTVNNAKGVLLPIFSDDMIEGAYSGTKLTIGIDFGTSNTVVAHKKVSEKEINLLSLNGNHYVKIYDEKSNHPSFQEFDRVINMFFIPDVFGVPENQDISGKPFSTEICYLNEVLKDEPILYSNITFKREISGDTKNEIKTNLKWSKDNDEHTNKLINMFFKELKSIIDKHTIENSIKLQNIEFRYSYPLAFSKNQIRNLQSIFVKMVGGEPQSFDESQCSQKFFTYSEKGELGIANQNPAITVDIGGGTSDIVGYMQRKTLFKNSLLFGGQDLLNDLIEDGTINNPFVKSLKTFLKNLADISNQDFKEAYSGSVLNKYKDSHSLFSYIISKEVYKTVIQEKVVNTEFFEFFRLTLLYFYSAILHFVGINVRKYYKLNNLDISTVQGTKIAFGGNGSRFLDWICSFNNWSKEIKKSTIFPGLFEYIYCASVDIRSDIDFKIIQSQKPKEEVVRGLLIDDSDADSVSSVLADSMFVGEDLVGDNENVGIYDDHSKIIRKNYSALRLKNYNDSEIFNFNKSFVTYLNSHKKDFEFEFSNKKTILKKFISIVDNFKESAISDGLNNIIQKYFANRDPEDEEYNNSYFITEVKVCLKLIMDNIQFDLENK